MSLQAYTTSDHTLFIDTEKSKCWLLRYTPGYNSDDTPLSLLCMRNKLNIYYDDEWCSDCPYTEDDAISAVEIFYTEHLRRDKRASAYRRSRDGSQAPGDLKSLRAGADMCGSNRLQIEPENRA